MSKLQDPKIPKYHIWWKARDAILRDKRILRTEIQKSGTDPTATKSLVAVVKFGALRSHNICL